MPCAAFKAGETPAYPVLFVLGEDAGDHVGGEAAVDLLANHGDGGETAGTDAAEGVEGELAIGGALAHLDTEVG